MLPLIIIGLCFIFFPVGFFIQQRNIRKNGIKINAVVIRTEKRRSSNRRRSTGASYFPVFKYTVEGVDFETEYVVGNILPKFNDGETVSIYYHKNKPQNISLPNDLSSEIFLLLFIIIGVGLVATGINALL